MSGEGPESIPTSADPKSRRPTKRRALTPSSAHAASVDSLFAKPDQEIRIPVGGGAVARIRAPPPEIVTNVQGSSAGAGSGEFHVYKASRRREYERLREMDEELKREKGQEEFETQRDEKQRRDEEKTRKNREKREKMKARKKNGKSNNNHNATNGVEAGKDDAIRNKVPETTAASAEEKEDKESSGEGTKTTTDVGKREDKVRTQEGTETQTAPPVETVGLIIHDDD